MQVINRPIEQVIPYEKNPRDNSRGIEKVAQSIKEFGWQQPIVVDRGGVIIVGHTRYEAAKLLGLTEVPVVVADNLSPEKVRAYRLADNKTADFSIWDNKKLLEELTDLSDLDVFTGFDVSELFENILDEDDKNALLMNDMGVVWEINFKSQDKDKIEKMIERWQELFEDDKG